MTSAARGRGGRTPRNLMPKTEETIKVPSCYNTRGERSLKGLEVIKSIAISSTIHALTNGSMSSSASKQPNKAGSRKRKLPRSFLECPSLSLVADFPPSKEGECLAKFVSTPVASDATKEIFLDRFSKEIVQPFRPKPENKGESFVMVNGRLQKQQTKSKMEKKVESNPTNKIWSQRVRMGTNQCLRILEECMSSGKTSSNKPVVIVLARDIYPPTMLSHVPVMAKSLETPVLLLPGKASSEIGQVVGVKKTSILLFLPRVEDDKDPANDKVDSFLEFVKSDMISK